MKSVVCLVAGLSLYNKRRGLSPSPLLLSFRAVPEGNHGSLVPRVVVPVVVDIALPVIAVEVRQVVGVDDQLLMRHSSSVVTESRHIQTLYVLRDTIRQPSDLSQASGTECSMVRA